MHTNWMRINYSGYRVCTILWKLQNWASYDFYAVVNCFSLVTLNFYIQERDNLHISIKENPLKLDMRRSETSKRFNALYHCNWIFRGSFSKFYLTTQAVLIASKPSFYIGFHKKLTELSLIFFLNYKNSIYNLQLSYIQVDGKLPCKFYLHSYIMLYFKF